MGGYVTGRVRAGDSPGSPVVGGSEYPDQSQVHFLSSDVEAPATPALPIVAPSAPTRLGAAAALAGADALLVWASLAAPGLSPPVGKSWPPFDTDWAWRWQKHPATPNPSPLGSSPYMSRDIDGILVAQQAIPSGGGSYIGTNIPWLGFANNSGPLVDPVATPIFTVVVQWDSQPVTVNGTPPVTTSSSMTAPGLPQLTNQPIIGNIYTNSPWILYCAWSGTWVGVPGAWTLALSSRLILAYGGSGGPTTTVAINGRRGGTDYIELDNTHHTITLRGATTSGAGIPPGSPEQPISTGASGPGGWPGDFGGYQEVFASSNMGPYYWESFRQLNGHIGGAAIVPLALEDTVTLVSERSLIPGTGPIVPNVKFRVGDHTSKPLSAELSECTHYWPLDDPSPGPMYDLLAGSYLTVVNPTLATFQTGGIVNPLAPTHTKALRLGRAARSNAYLTWAGSGPAPSIGTGAVGHDLTIGCWIRWEGPVGSANEREIIQSGYVTFGFVGEPALAVRIWPYAEPFGVEFQTWDATGHTFKTLRTTEFDWPADYLLDSGDPMRPYVYPIPYKGPLWAYLVVVLRTVSGHMTQEIWVDGVLLAQQAGADGGWGANVNLLYVGRGITPAALQHLTIWPFALSAAAISGIGA